MDLGFWLPRIGFWYVQNPKGTGAKKGTGALRIFGLLFFVQLI